MQGCNSSGKGNYTKMVLQNMTYREIIDQYIKAKTPEERQNCQFTMTCMIANNHLPHIEEKVNTMRKTVAREKEQRERLETKLTVGFVIMLLAVLFQSQISMTSILTALMRLF